MRFKHPQLVDLLQRAYSAERAAALAYIGHARSVADPAEVEAIGQIEDDEWHHRDVVLKIMQHHDVPVSRYYEIKYFLIGKLIGYSCYVIGWFMPFYFAGRLESGNVCEYFRMLQWFDELGIRDHHEVLHEMGVKEKEHEVYFLNKLKTHRLLPLFERWFAWGNGKSFNDVHVEAEFELEQSRSYCRDDRAGRP